MSLSPADTIPSASPLKRREDSVLPARMALSATNTEGSQLRGEDFPDWFAWRAGAGTFRVEPIPFADLENWSFDAQTGNLGHASGRFFTVEGLHVIGSSGPVAEWQQPIIVQPEVGILGILAKEFDGVLHFLLQAKMEPGNPNLVQLSPTVQATRSNYTRVHQGATVRYLEYFTEPGRGRVIADVLQSEHGAWFFRKANRNIIVETFDDVPPHEDFCWLTLGQIGALLRRDNLVNMDARTVLACAPMEYAEVGAMNSDRDVLSWFTGERSRHQVRARLVPLAKVEGWVRNDWSIEHVPERFFRVMAVAVAASNREVTGWTQPLIEPIEPALAGFVVRRFGGVPHVLAHGRVEGGLLDRIELGPTVQCTPTHYATAGAVPRPPFLDLMLAAAPDRIRYAAVHSEEGGRFRNAVSQYLVVEADEAQAPTQPPPGYLWITPGQLNLLVRHGHYVNVQARTLLACFNARAVRL